MRETVRRADHEGIEGVPGMRAGTARPVRDRSVRCGGRQLLAGLDSELDTALLAGRVEYCFVDQAEKVVRDPVSREVVSNTNDERLVGEPNRPGGTEEDAESRLAESVLEIVRNLSPHAVRARLD